MARAVSTKEMNLARLPNHCDPREVLEQAGYTLDTARRAGNHKLVASSALLALAARRALGELPRDLLSDATALVCNPFLTAPNRVDLLIELSGWEAQSGYRDAALVSAFEARRQAEKLNDDSAIARATLSIAKAAVFSGADRKVVLAAFDEAVRRFAELDQPKGVASAYFHSATMMLLTMDEAARAAERLVRVRELNVDDTPVAKAWACGRHAIEAITRAKLGQHEAAAALAGEASKLADDGGSIDPRIPALVLLARGSAALASGDTETAITELAAALTLGEPLDMPEWNLEALRQLARAHFIVGDTETATATADRQIDVKAKADRYAFPHTWWESAATYVTFNDPVPAVSDF
jgi:tetratricopeptide (TPR) repeat protein